MKNEMTIGVMGGLVNNTNLGCQALTYSLLYELESIVPNDTMRVKYIIFEYDQKEDGIIQIGKELKINKDRLELAPIGKFYFYNPKKLLGTIVAWKQNLKMIKAIKKCDVVIDITQGDSFTDLYGLYRFYTLTSIKWLVEKIGIPLVLAPQTYGPFKDEHVKQFAQKVIEKAKIIVSRDSESEEYLKSFIHSDVITVTDLAFALPYQKKQETYSEKIKIGINPSGLLSKSKTEGTALNNKILANYDQLMLELIDYLKAEQKYEIHLIPHVGNEAYVCLPNIDGIIYHRAFKNPVEAKNTIAQMDVFVGARMHATIAAFSSGVPTIPIAYSRKFEGLFGSLGYNHVIDITKLNTEQAFETTIREIKDYKVLKQDVDRGMIIAEEKRLELRDILEKVISQVKEND